MTYIAIVVLLLDLLWVLGTESAISDNNPTIQEFKGKHGYDISFMLLVITACVCAANTLISGVS